MGVAFERDLVQKNRFTPAVARTYSACGTRFRTERTRIFKERTTAERAGRTNCETLSLRERESIAAFSVRNSLAKSDL